MSASTGIIQVCDRSNYADAGVVVSRAFTRHPTALRGSSPGSPSDSSTDTTRDCLPISASPIPIRSTQSTRSPVAGCGSEIADTTTVTARSGSTVASTRRTDGCGSGSTGPCQQVPISIISAGFGAASTRTILRLCRTLRTAAGGRTPSSPWSWRARFAACSPTDTQASCLLSASESSQPRSARSSTTARGASERRPGRA